jgi:predicted nucleotidyltransferase
MNEGALTVKQLRVRAQEADALHARSREILTEAVREGARAGLTQRQIAEAVGRSQPEVSRLLRFQPKSRLGRLLVKHRREVLEIIAQAGFSQPRVFGSVVHGTDTETSDIDLLVHSHPTASLFSFSRLELELEKLLGVSVDVVPDNNLRPYLVERVLAEAVPL